MIICNNFKIILKIFSFIIYVNDTVLYCVAGAEISPANSSHASAYYSEYTERFDFICFGFCEVNCALLL